MYASANRGRTIAVWTFAVPLGLFAGYVAWIVVPEVLRIVVPTVVRAVTGT